MDTYDFIIKEGSVDPGLEVQLTDTEGSAIGLSNAEVKFVMRGPGSDTIYLKDDSVIRDSDEGIVVYLWDTGDTNTPGDYNGEFLVDYAASGTFEPDEKFPRHGYISIHIEESLE